VLVQHPAVRGGQLGAGEDPELVIETAAQLLIDAEGGRQGLAPPQGKRAGVGIARRREVACGPRRLGVVGQCGKGDVIKLAGRVPEPVTADRRR